MQKPALVFLSGKDIWVFLNTLFSWRFLRSLVRLSLLRALEGDCSGQRGLGFSFPCHQLSPFPCHRLSPHSLASPQGWPTGWQGRKAGPRQQHPPSRKKGVRTTSSRGPIPTIPIFLPEPQGGCRPCRWGDLSLLRAGDNLTNLLQTLEPLDAPTASSALQKGDFVPIHPRRARNRLLVDCLATAHGSASMKFFWLGVLLSPLDS